MDNYKSYKPDASDQAYCEICGMPIEDPQIMAPGTEYECEVALCEKCFNEETANAPEEAII
jgi:hypothetical protein